MAENDAGNLLVVILDTNPCQQSFLGKDPAKFTQWINASLAFLNLHLSLNQTNEVALLSSGLRHAEILLELLFKKKPVILIFFRFKIMLLFIPTKKWRKRSTSRSHRRTI